MTISLRCLKTDSSKNGEKRVSIVYAREHVTVNKTEKISVYKRDLNLNYFEFFEFFEFFDFLDFFYFLNFRAKNTYLIIK